MKALRSVFTLVKALSSAHASTYFEMWGLSRVISVACAARGHVAGAPSELPCQRQRKLPLPRQIAVVTYSYTQFYCLFYEQHIIPSVSAVNSTDRVSGPAFIAFGVGMA